MATDKIPVLCTRPLPEWLLKEAAQSGIAVTVQSFIQTEPINTVEVQQEIENALLQSVVVVFTSMNAVSVVADHLEGQQPDWSIYCIGHATQKLVAEHFGEHRIAGTASDAAELASLIAEESVTDEVIFFCGDQRRDELPSILQEHGIAVDEIVVYQTVELAHKLNDEYMGVLFFSPSAVRSFFKSNKLPPQTVAFAIGTTTAAEIKKFATNKIIVSNEPGKEEMMQKVMEYFT